MRIQGPRWPLDKPFAEAGAISRYPRLPFGVIHAMRGAKHPAARLRVCEWRTRAGVVVLVDISSPPDRGGAAASAARAINNTR
jgi:hypothetical protein